MGLYLGSTRIRAVNTNYQTTTYNTNDATVTNGSEIIRGYTAYSKGAKYTGTAPKVFLAATAPTSGMQSGDIWVITSGVGRKTGTFSTSIEALSATAPGFTEWYNYSTYARTSSCSASATISGNTTASNITVSYTINYTTTDPGTYSDYNYTFYYNLQFIGSSGTYDVVNSSVSVGHGKTGNVSGEVTIAATTDGYFKLTIYYTLEYLSALNTTSITTAPSIAKQSTDLIGTMYPLVPNSTTVYMNEAKIYNGKMWI